MVVGLVPSTSCSKRNRTLQCFTPPHPTPTPFPHIASTSSQANIKNNSVDNKHPKKCKKTPWPSISRGLPTLSELRGLRTWTYEGLKTCPQPSAPPLLTVIRHGLHPIAVPIEHLVSIPLLLALLVLFSKPLTRSVGPVQVTGGTMPTHARSANDVGKHFPCSLTLPICAPFAGAQRCWNM